MRLIGPYELIADLGSGAMGKVYRARDTRLDREVALKVLWPQLAELPVAVTRFEREARAEARLRHPNVVAVYDIGAADGHHYLAMEYVAGYTLRELIQQPLPAAKALYYFKQILAGLSVAHEQGVLHRDLKPGNILIASATDTVKLADFGLARIIGEEISLTQSGAMLGTIEYMAPELMRGESGGRQADLYAAGVILYRLLTGRLPFQGATSVAVLEAHECGIYPPATTITGGLPPQADVILARLLACEPTNRYADCQAILADLERWEQGGVIQQKFAAAYELLDHEIKRYRLPRWKRVWQRVMTWMRYQWLEVFDQTELTAIRIRDEVVVAARDLSMVRQRLEAALLLQNQARASADEARAENLEKDAKAAEAAATLAREEYVSRAALLSELRHTADLLLARRRRAKLELSLLGVLPVQRRRWAERSLAAAKLVGLVLIALVGLYLIFRPEISHPQPEIPAVMTLAAINQSTESADTPVIAGRTTLNDTSGWRSLPPLRFPRMYFATAVVADSLYVLGGSNRHAYISEIERYDPDRNRWELYGTLSVPRMNFSAVALNGKIYYAGGYNREVNYCSILENDYASYENRYLRDLQEFDPLTRRNRLITTLPFQRSEFSMVAAGDEIYFIGGKDTAYCSVSEVNVFNLATRAWRKTEPLNVPLVRPAAAAVGGNIYIVGGWRRINDNYGNNPVDSAERYDPTTNRWTWTRSPRSHRGIMERSAVVLNGKIYLLGGLFSNYNPIDTVDKYDPVTDMWSTVANISDSGYYFRAEAVGNRIIVIGGLPSVTQENQTGQGPARVDEYRPE